MKRALAAAAIVAGCGGKAAAPAESVTNAQETPPACLADVLDAALPVSLERECRGDVEGCRAACDGGDLSTCVTLAYALEADPRTARDAIDAYRRACEGGVDIGCTNYASYLLDGHHGLIAADAECAHRIHQWSCAHETAETWGCGMVGLELVRGNGTAPDPTGARRVLEDACEARGGFACAVLGNGLEHGELGDAPDPDAAREKYQRGCDTGNSIACADLESLAP